MYSASVLGTFMISLAQYMVTPNSRLRLFSQVSPFLYVIRIPAAGFSLLTKEKTWLAWSSRSPPRRKQDAPS